MHGYLQWLLCHMTCMQHTNSIFWPWASCRVTTTCPHNRLMTPMSCPSEAIALGQVHQKRSFQTCSQNWANHHPSIVALLALWASIATTALSSVGLLHVVVVGGQEVHYPGKAIAGFADQGDDPQQGGKGTVMGTVCRVCIYIRSQ